MSDEPMTPVRLSRLVLRDDSDQQWLFLSERDGERAFPIVIGNPEASEIRATHDVCPKMQVQLRTPDETAATAKRPRRAAVAPGCALPSFRA